MWEDPVLEELHRIREEHAIAFNYDFKAIFADWQKKQSESGKKLVSLELHKSDTVVAHDEDWSAIINTQTQEKKS